MDKSIKGTRTEQNLLKAFAGESQGKNRYIFFAKQAQKDGYEQIAAIFLETAQHEESHAKNFFKFFEGGDVEITATYSTGNIRTTAENLLESANGENERWSKTYSTFAKIADEEGFPKIASKFKLIATIEARHEARFRKLYENITNGSVFVKEKKVKWVCRKCGFMHEGEKALQNCPACDHPQAYFEVMSENY